MTVNRPDRLAVHRAVQRRYRPDRAAFGRLVLDALAELPDQFRSRLDNVAIVVEEWPPASESADSGRLDLLLGLYQGTPYPHRGEGYHLRAPDRITIYRGPILALRGSRDEVRREVRDTLRHEIGHYFGLDESELP